MFGYNPAGQLFKFSFAKNYMQAPQQLMSRFWNRCAMETYNSIQHFEPIMPQVDGHDFDPYPTGLPTTIPRTDSEYTTVQGKYAGGPFQESPFQQFDIKQVGIKFRGHTINHAIAKTTGWTLSIDYRNLLASIFAASIARFRDRVMLYNADNTRVINNTWTKTMIGAQTENFPDSQRYVIADGKAGKAVPDLKYLDLETLMDMRTFFDNDELMGMGTPVCTASPYQIRNLLNDNKIQNFDYNTAKALVRGEVNSFMGFEFIKCKMGQTTAVAKDMTNFPALQSTITVGTVQNASDFNRWAVKGGVAAAGDYKAIPEAEKVVFSYPAMAFGCGYIPSAGFLRVVEDQYRSFAWKFMLQEVIAYRRKQDEYVRVAYAKKAERTGVAPRRAPAQLKAYYANYSLNGRNWQFGSQAQTAA